MSQLPTPTKQNTLWNSQDQSGPRMECYRPTGPAKGILVIFPGGGYGDHTPREQAPIVDWGQKQGFFVALIYYRVHPHGGYPDSYHDGLEGIAAARAWAKSEHPEPLPLHLIGFSAGGHLAAHVACKPNDARHQQISAHPGTSTRPDNLLLLYPVISMQTDSIRGIVTNLLGPNPTPKMLREASCEEMVTAKVPRTFIVHGTEDSFVPASHSRMFEHQLIDHGVDVESHFFAHNVHGFAMREEDPVGKLWPELAASWLRRSR